MASVEDTASRMQRGPEGDRAVGSAYLLVVENNSSSIVHLPREGAIVIGRASEADVKVDHASVTRRHATIRIEGGVMRIADLGSRNGTKVNGERVHESRVLSSGDVASVGDVVLVVHVTNPPVVSRSTFAEAGWRRRLAEELDRAITYKRSLAVLALSGVEPAVVAEVGDAVRLIDVIGEGTDGSALVILPEVERDQARAIAATVLATLRSANHEIRGGLALCPSDACDVDSMLVAARNAAEKAEPGTFAEASEAATEIQLGSRTVMVLDPAMRRVYGLLERLAAGALRVLINGETGVGKEAAAYAVHHWSKRTGPFVDISCANLDDNLAESRLFGHDKGAFTGATAAKPGVFEVAAGGTVFLDEVAELSMGIQAKLLRTLQEKTVTRLGETRGRPVDVLIVAATHRDLEVEVAEGRFRADLKFRLAEATVCLPPLRDRRCEIPMLARKYLADFCRENGAKPKEITPDAMQALLTYGWDGNVRELVSAMKYSAAMAPDDRVEPSDLHPKILGTAAIAKATTGEIPVVTGEAPSSFRPLKEEIEDLEKQRMREAMTAAAGVKTKAAQLIGMPIRTFTEKLKQYKLVSG